MSPEQVRAQPIDARTDLFSFGVVLYEMATGQRRFPGDSSGLIFEAILNPSADSAAAAQCRTCRRNSSAIVGTCLEKDRDLRYQHASEIRTDLQRLKRDRESGRVPASRHAQARRAVPVGRGTLSMLGSRHRHSSSAVAAWAFYSRRPPTLTDKDTIVLADFTNTTGDPLSSTRRFDKDSRYSSGNRHFSASFPTIASAGRWS